MLLLIMFRKILTFILKIFKKDKPYIKDDYDDYDDYYPDSPI